MTAASLLRVALACACALSLAGCISLLPKSKPSALYRFGGATSAEAGQAAASGSVGVLRAGGLFQREAAGDRLLTVTDGKVAYVAQSRWVAPASILWEQALLAAFDADAGRVRLMSRGEAGAADYILRIDVRNFEAHYDAGKRAAPTVLVRVRATMSGRTGAPAGEQMFEARKTAGDNRVGAIVSAYDEAVGDVLGQLVAWTNAQAKPAA